MLVSAAHYGALALGADIDVRVLKGKDGRSIGTNFEHYNFPNRMLGLVCADISQPPLVARPVTFKFTFVCQTSLFVVVVVIVVIVIVVVVVCYGLTSCIVARRNHC